MSLMDSDGYALFLNELLPVLHLEQNPDPI